MYEATVMVVMTLVAVNKIKKRLSDLDRNVWAESKILLDVHQSEIEELCPNIEYMRATFRIMFRPMAVVVIG